MKKVLQYFAFCLLIAALTASAIFQSNMLGNWSVMWVSLFVAVVVLVYLQQLRVVRQPFRKPKPLLYLYLQTILLSGVSAVSVVIFKFGFSKLWLLVPALLLMLWLHYFRLLLGSLR
ncbi:MAG: hypothetical protein LPJ89_09280 [Hymenobacteraceae bacterium]|nr:hypothetical protein [Hymenobacteraceae bacterium]MDX5396376.1 hypothetical protein [Hymenobacteraceae bacterium]MDX5443957.1 hypothetical protein [Hymenobacteraceae bacterium]MDX5512438.1 hypothetical protein [Hymenobacteraceae bacterium]